jgi:hypothetical protein
LGKDLGNNFAWRFFLTNPTHDTHRRMLSAGPRTVAKACVSHADP